ncbi:hypothetical protein EOD41_01910 [Mucilaginibacter limnophilus]|uniref:Uncharacterized protein n=1 Tax=Mucilaginibacter limnophilus TaxID=1932778 RepID=A0A3S2UPC5_9SPHI|nr:hypothetical protein [Mucilaginibacter limnophilus]RVU02720.1 hypothetical protein EOD41_01910 [Mucilaginibacter limnophilus]
MKLYSYIVIISTFCLPTITKGQDTSNLLKESLESAAKNVLQLNELNISNDTLNIVSESGFLFYPFGKHKSFAQFKAANLKFNYKDIYLKNQLTNEIVRGYQLHEGKSYVKLLIEDEDDDNRVMIIRGEISDSVIFLKNRVHVGMDKQKFLQLFFARTPNNSINVINLKSALEGIIHTYTFKQNKLQSIKFYTDYMVL